VFSRRTNLEKFGHKRWCKHVGESWSNAELAYLTFTGGKPRKATEEWPGGTLGGVPKFNKANRAAVTGKRIPNEPPVAPDEEPVKFAEKDSKGRRVLAKTENISLRPTRAFDV